MVRQAVRQAHGPERGRRIFHPNFELREADNEKTAVLLPDISAISAIVGIYRNGVFSTCNYLRTGAYLLHRIRW